MTEPQQPLNLMDLGLWRRAVAGETESVRVLLDDQMPTVYGFVLARVGGNQDVAADIVQETLAEAVRSAATYRGEAALVTWLCRIARRRIARHWERERRQEAATAGLRLVMPETDVLEVASLRAEVMQALSAISAVHRQVLVLKYLDDLTVDQIAAELGRSRVQVQSLLQRARVAFRAALTGDDESG